VTIAKGGSASPENFTVIVEIASGGPFSSFIVVPTEAFGYWLMVFVRSMTRRKSE
jgi:hypothetical protein